MLERQRKRVTDRNVDFKRQVVRNIAPIIVLVFLLLAIFFILVQQGSVRENLDATHRTGVAQIATGIEREREELTTELLSLATSSNVRDFVGASGPLSEKSRYQTPMLSDFYVLMSSNQAFLTMRYITNAGSVWGTVNSKLGFQSIDPVFHEGVYENNPDFQRSQAAKPGELVIGSFQLKTDSLGTPLDPPELLLSVYMPVIGKTETISDSGFIEIDIDGASLLSSVKNSFGNTIPYVDGRRIILMDTQGNVIVDSYAPGDSRFEFARSTTVEEVDSIAETEEIEVVERLPFDNLLYNQLHTLTGGFHDDIFSYRDYIISIRDVSLGKTTNDTWKLILVDEANSIFVPANTQSAIIFVVMMVLALIVILIIDQRLTGTFAPLTAANKAARRLAVAQMDEDASIDSNPNEVAGLMWAMDQISRRIHSLTEDFDRQVAFRTRDLEVAARIGREIATLHDIDELLNRAIDLICKEMGYYHAQVFLIDDVHVNAVLAYSRGEAGQKLLAQNHKIAVGSNTLVGTVTHTGKPLIVNDVQAGTGPHIPNPMLPDTRAEMGLPLLIGERVIGALDIQSRQPSVFREANLPTFQLLADQLAVAIYNTQKIVTSEKRIEQIMALDRQHAHSAWQEAENRLGFKRSYLYNLLQTREQEGVTAPEIDGLAAPIMVRGVPIGALSAATPENLTFTSGDQALLRAVADRVAYAIENARLFQETQSSLAETSTLYQLSQALNEATALNDIVHAIINIVMPDAVGGQLWVFDEYVGDKPEWIELIADLAIGDRESSTDDIVGWRLNIQNAAFLDYLQNNQVTIVNDIQRDTRIEERIQRLFERLAMRSVILIPLNIRGEWRGLISLGSPEPREFSEKEGRIYSALIDQAGVAIDNRLLLQQTEDALSRNESLYAASRMIITAQTLQDLVYAAVATTDNRELEFWLGLLEGDLDETGWPTRVRIVARSENGMVHETSEIQPIDVHPASPLRERQPEVIVDTAPGDPNVPSYILWMRQHQTRFMAIFPLFSANQPIAFFYLTAMDIQDLSMEDYEVYRALTGQISIQLQNRRLLAQTEQALDETRRLYIASRAIASAQDSTHVYEAATEHLVRPLTQTDSETIQHLQMTILLAEPEPTINAPYLRYVHTWSNLAETEPAHNRGDRVTSKEVPFGRFTAKIDGIYYTPNIEADLPKEPKIRTALQVGTMVSAIIAPIEVHQKWFGILLCESDQPNAFDEQYQRFVQALVDQVAIAVENQQLFEASQLEAFRAQQEAQRALALAEAGQLASNIGTDFERNINEVLRRVSHSAGYNHWILALADSEHKRLETVVFETPFGRPKNDKQSNFYYDLQEGSDSLIDAYHLDRPIIVNDPINYPAFNRWQKEDVEAMGKHIAIPVRSGEEILGALLLGRELKGEDLDERDEQLITILAAQVAVALENRRLFQAAESERETLSSILSTLPAGVVVLDPRTYTPLISNDKAVDLLGTKINEGVPFSATSYDLYRTGTDLHYPNDELPMMTALKAGSSTFSDDVALITPEKRTDLLVNAAPILDASGEVTAIVAAFEDISNLRKLENTLQENLEETVALYEAQRALAEAEELDDVLDVVIMQLMIMQPDDVYVILLDDETGEARVVREMVGAPDGFVNLPNVLDNADVLHIHNVAKQPELDDETRNLLTSAGILSLMSIPLRVRSLAVPIGWLVVTSRMADMFSPDQERMLTSLTDVSATAIDNRNLFRTTQIAYEETSALYDVTTAVSRAVDLDQMGDALKAALKRLNPDCYALYLADDTGMIELFNIAEVGEPLDFKSLLRYPLPESGLQIDNLDDYEDGELGQALRALGKVRALAGVNLRIKDAPNGRLFVGYYQPNYLSEGNMRFLRSLGDSVSLRADNLLLFDQIQSTLEETSTLYQASRVLSDAGTPEEILDVVVDYLIGFYTNQVFVGLLNTRTWDASGANLKIVASWQGEGSIDMTGVTLASDQFPAWNRLSSSNVVLINDVEADETLSPMEKAGFEGLDARSVAIMPLRVAQRAIGVIWMGSNEPHEYTDREMRTYQAFSEQASLSIEATHLLEQADRRARQLETSSLIGENIARILDLDELLPEVVNLIKDAFEYDHVQVFMMDADQEWAMLRASTGEAGRRMLESGHKLPKGSGSVIGQVTATGEASIALDTADATVVHRPNPYLPLTRSEMALPLMIQDRVVGALDLQSNQPNAFSEEDMRVLTILAGQIAVAIDNANLYAEIQSRASEMSFLFDITTIAAAAETVSEALENIASRLYGSIRALSVTIYMPQMFVDVEENVYTIMKPMTLVGSDQPLSEVSEVPIDDETNLVAMVSHSMEPVIVPNIVEESRYLPVVSTARSAILSPVSAGTELVGLIVMEDSRPNAYDGDDLQLIQTLSGSVSAIIRSAQLLEQISKANEELRELDRLKSDFLANMSHELRTPLNSIIGFSRVMLKGIDGPLTEMQEQDLTTIYNSGQHLLMLINDVLDQAKIASGKMDLKLGYFDVKPLVEGVRSIGIGLLKDNPIDMRVELAPNLPQVYGDEFRTRQVLLNLVSNAAKFTQEGSITLRVYPEMNEKEERLFVRLDVIDTGIGIADKDLPLLFEAFQQIDSSLTRTVGGTGLGLPIAKSLVEMQGGEMVVSSQVNVGSTFSFTLSTEPVNVEGETDKKKDEPTTAAPSAPPPQPETKQMKPITPRPAAPKGPSHKVMSTKRQVLLIEDNPDMVDQFRRIIQREGFEVFAATIPLEAEAMASGLHPTIVVMDVNFANGKGWDILKSLKGREDTLDIPVVIVSLSDEEERAMEIGAFAFVARPFTPENLATIVLEAEKDSNTERILIIDDEPESVRLITEALNQHGKYRVFAADNGIDGISLVARRRPNLIILDLRMQDMDGFKVLDQLQANPETANIPVMVVTGEIINEEEQARLEHVQVLEKTVISEDNGFIDSVQAHLNGLNNGGSF